MNRTGTVTFLSLALSAGAMFVGSRCDAAEPDKKPVFRAGAAASVITPALGTSLNGGMRDRKAMHVHDELHARALVLDDGAGKLALVVCDSCMIPRDIMDDAKQRASAATGIPVERMIISATHTHSAPTATGVFQSEPDEEYRRFLPGRIADAIRRANNNLAPAQIGWASGSVPGQVFNRRWKMKPGTIAPDPFGRPVDLVKMNPPAMSENLVEPAGPTDPEVCVLAVRSPDGRPIALLANYSLHYVAGVPGNDVSADYYGAFAERIAELLAPGKHDPPFVGIMSNGTSGDCNNVNFRAPRPKQGPYEQVRIVANDVAQEAKSAYGKIQWKDHVKLDARLTVIELGVRRPDDADLKAAQARLAAAASKDLVKVEDIYARETVLMAKYPPKVELVLSAFRIGDHAICAIPCEVFCEIGLELKAKSPFKPTFTMSLANGYNGYLPTPEHHRLGGYETWRAQSSYLEPAASPVVVGKLLAMLGEMAGK